MHSIQERVEAVRSRQQRQWLWQTASLGLVAGGVVGCGLGVARLLGMESLSLVWIAAAVVACPSVGLVYGLAVPRRTREAATAIDRQYRLKDRIATAFNFMHQAAQSPLQQLQLDDARMHVAAVDPAQVAPFHAPRSWGWGLVLSLAALLIAFLSGPRDEVEAAIVQNDVVMNQAVRVAAGLEELEKFNEELADPEVEKLLKELAEKIEELKQPGVDPKEALAKLSEMEAALQAKQEQLADPGTEAALQEIGEALALAEPFQAAGEAMSQGEMEKAAEELSKLEMPKLDRQTERALTEKLDQAKQNSSPGAQRQLREAASQVAAGLTQGDRSKFKDGMEGLASECKKQGNRKKLSDLLRKQCNSLAECKSECEGACKSQAESKKKGGKNWGLASSGNDPGDKTAKLKTGPQMQITGTESASGDVDIETMSSPEQQQEAIRQYRDKVDKYEQISESVLDSEPIPLGHRQTIRRYFEMIRPQGDETDAVIRETEEASTR
ncbi:MAG TPA: hypothetical protein VMM76_03050 [Pirellulaceae bacterium]|nr:hypothetical protein [Pirellulaceae bacterium]